MVVAMNSWMACHEFEPSATENPPYRGADAHDLSRLRQVVENLRASSSVMVVVGVFMMCRLIKKKKEALDRSKGFEDSFGNISSFIREDLLG
ncbi:hypothetical protein TNCV_1506971 [Trichonephila clavipes]|nr:hypothetical protein TNCV_1506971 [Trichonephila clavipes]